MDVDLISLNGKVSDNKVISYIKRTDLHVNYLLTFCVVWKREKIQIQNVIHPDIFQ